MPSSSVAVTPDTIPSGFLLERDRSSCHLTEHLSHMYEINAASSSAGGLMTDVIILCQDHVQLRAHRSVLAAASPYLHDALRDLPDGEVGITVQGYRGSLVGKLLEFVYMGRATVSNDEESAFTQLLYDWEVGDTGSSIEHTSDNTQERSQRKKGASPVVILEEEEDQEEVGERAEQESTFMEVEITRSPDDDEVAAEEGDPLNSKSEKKKAGTKRKRSRSSLECEVCGQVLKTKTGHRLHMLSHQGSEGKAFRCGVCGKAFSQASQLKTHTRIHTGERPYKCDQCDRSFSHASTLSEHKNLHNALKPFQCTICSQSFAQKKALRAHRCQQPAATAESGDASAASASATSFICPFCNRTFGSRRGLSIHKMHQHAETGSSGEPLLQCDHCADTFSSEQAYEHHLESAHPSAA